MNAANPKLTVHAGRLELAIRRRGFASVKEFAEFVGLHRNTVGNYLSGKSTLPDGLARILVALDLEPGEVIELSPAPRTLPALEIAPLIDGLHAAMPEAAFVLFGSRARGDAKPLSDYDVGVYTMELLRFAEYSSLLDRVADWNEHALANVQLTNLTRADDSFLQKISPDLVFLAGSLSAWVDLLRKAGIQLHGR